MARAWVFNIDAEFELEGRTPDARTRRRTELLVIGLAQTLPEGDFAVGVDDRCTPGLEGVAWCPTPRALERLRAAGARVPEAPPLAVLRTVNDRRFAHHLVPLPGAHLVRGFDEAEEAMRRPGRWRLRRGLGFAGRGVRRVEGSAVSPDDLAYARASLRRGTLLVEPDLEVGFDVALHGHTDGRIGIETVQEVDRFGQWAASRAARPYELTASERGVLRETLVWVREALLGAGYQGPFGIDGFRYCDGQGRGRFHPLSDLNARFTMGWPVGMGGW